MRSGRLLAEESPQVLLSMYQSQSLEEVFLKLSRKQGQVGNGAIIQNGSTKTTEKPNIQNNISAAAMNWNKSNDSIYMSEESGVVGLNFYQSKEVLVNDILDEVS